MANARTTKLEDRAPHASIPPAADGAEPKPPSGLPGWAPGAVLALLVTISLVGGFGLSRSSKATSSETRAPIAAEPEPASTGAASPPATGTQPAQSANPPPADSRSMMAAHLVVGWARSPLARNQNILRTKEEARARAIEARGRALKGEDFRALAREYSDDGEKADRPPREYRYSDMVKSFADEVFKLQPGEVSEPIETPLGYFIIKRSS